MKKTLYLFFCAIVSGTYAVAAAESTSELSEKLTIPHERYQLSNGLTVILSEDHSTPFVATSLWYSVGAADEVPNKTGLAHLFEHLMFEGSKHVKDDGHFKILEYAGASSVNATTSFDRTNYYQTMPKSQLELALSLESSRMTFLDLTQEKLDEQRAVVRREREQRYETSPYGLGAIKLWQNIFPPTHPFYGRIIGSHEDLEAATLDDVQAFYDKHYGPSNASLALVGDFNPQEAKNLINKYFGTLPASTRQKTPKLPDVKIDKEEVIYHQEKIGKLPLVRIQYVSPALFKPGDAELDIISHILTGGEFGRLTKAITREKELANAVAAYQQSYSQVSVFTIDATLNPGVNEKDVIRAIDTVLSDLVKNPPTATEIERARNALFKDYFFGLQVLGGNSGRAEVLQSYWRFAGDSDYMQKDIKRYLAITPTSIAGYAKNYLPVGESRKILIAKPLEANQLAVKE